MSGLTKTTIYIYTYNTKFEPKSSALSRFEISRAELTLFLATVRAKLACSVTELRLSKLFQAFSERVISSFF